MAQPLPRGASTATAQRNRQRAAPPGSPPRAATLRAVVNVGPLEILLVAVIALLVLGPRRLPEAGRALGASIRGFREALSGRDRPFDDDALAADSAPRERAHLAGSRRSDRRTAGDARDADIYDEAQP